MTNYGDHKQIRCIDCWFGPPEPQFVFVGTAVYVGIPRENCARGQTGDVLADYNGRWFEPHGDIENRFALTDEKQELAQYRWYQPERLSERVEECWEE